VAAGLLYVIQTKRFPSTPLDYYVVAYAAAETLSTLFSVEPFSSLITMKRLLLIAAVYLTLVSINTKQKFVWAIFLVVAITAVLSFIESFIVIGIGDASARLSVFQHYMTAGGIKMIIALLVLPFLIDNRIPTRWRWAAAASLLWLLIALLLTQTRSSWLGLVAGTITVGIIRSKKLLIGTVACIILFFVIAPSTYTHRAASIFDPTLTSNVARLHMISTGWRMFLDYPVFGTGDIDLKSLYVTYTEPIDFAEGGHLHNNFMTLLVTLGIVGFTAVMALFVKIFLLEYSIVQRLRGDWLYGTAALGCFAAYIAFHVNGLFEWNFGDHEIALLLWFTIGLALVSRNLSRGDHPDSGLQNKENNP
jgi:O-antigen ligase